MKFLLLTVVLLINVFAIRCRNCVYKDTLHWRITAGGQREAYCLSPEIKPRDIKLNEKMRTDNCYDCVCSLSGLYCCGIGIKAYDVILPPEGCQLLIGRNCGFSFRSKYNKNLPCLRML